MPGYDARGETTTIFGLSPGTDYTFRMTAVNVMGKGEPSLPSHPVQTKPAPPSRAPENLGGGGGRVGDLQIRWEPLRRQDENGPGIGYFVRYVIAK